VEIYIAQKRGNVRVMRFRVQRFKVQRLGVPAVGPKGWTVTGRHGSAVLILVAKILTNGDSKIVLTGFRYATII
jgi:hypothetical protein